MIYGLQLLRSWFLVYLKFNTKLCPQKCCPIIRIFFNIHMSLEIKDHDNGQHAKFYDILVDFLQTLIRG